MLTINNNIAPVALQRHFQTNMDVHHYSTRQLHDFHLPRNTNCWTEKSIVFQGPRQRLEVSQKLQQSQSTQTFSKQIKGFCIN